MERLLQALHSITEYLYSRYGHYDYLDKEVRQMLKPLFDPKVKATWKREGRVEGKLEVAEKLLQKGIMSIPEIAEVTGLSVEQVTRFQGGDRHSL